MKGSCPARATSLATTWQAGEVRPTHCRNAWVLQTGARAQIRLSAWWPNTRERPPHATCTDGANGWTRCRSDGPSSTISASLT